MWFKAECKLPYHKDPDYCLTLVSNIKSLLGREALVDVTMLEGYGWIEVDMDESSVAILQQVPTIGEIRHSIDREIVAGPRIFL